MNQATSVVYLLATTNGQYNKRRWITRQFHIENATTRAVPPPMPVLLPFFHICRFYFISFLFILNLCKKEIIDGGWVFSVHAFVFIFCILCTFYPSNHPGFCSFFLLYFFFFSNKGIWFIYCIKWEENRIHNIWMQCWTNLNKFDQK